MKAKPAFFSLSCLTCLSSCSEEKNEVEIKVRPYSYQEDNVGILIESSCHTDSLPLTPTQVNALETKYP